ncbi:hypothetical protein PSPO01_16428 [Paraphaeosphaeria sporulosa]
MPGRRGLADSRSFAERVSRPLHHTKGMASCPLASACGLASIYDYVHFASRSDVSVPVFVPQITIPVCMPYMKPCFSLQLCWGS